MRRAAKPDGAGRRQRVHLRLHPLRLEGRRSAVLQRSTPTTIGGRKESASARKRAWLTDIYNDLACDAPRVPGYNGATVRKVPIVAIRETMVKRGYLEAEDGKVPASERKAFQRAREELIRSGLFAGDDENLWSLK
jgi:hypothetical protein